MGLTSFAYVTPFWSEAGGNLEVSTLGLSAAQAEKTDTAKAAPRNAVSNFLVI